MLIGILGLAGSGKSTVAATLANRLDGCAVISVAAPIKAMLLGLGLQTEDFSSRRKERVIQWIGKSPRALMQSLGDWGRLEHPTIWANLLEARIASHMQPITKGKRKTIPDVIVEDIRLPMEAGVLRAHGGLLLRVSRPGQQPKGHHTERAGQLIDVDATLINDGGLADIKAKALEWLMDYLEDG